MAKKTANISNPIAFFTGSAAVDRPLFWMVIVLAVMGMLAVFSAVKYLAETKAGGNVDVFIIKHSMMVLLSLGSLLFFSQVNYRKVAEWSKYTLILAIGLLIAVKFVGVYSKGAARSIGLFTPSDIARVSLVFYIAHLLAAKQSYIRDLKKGFVPILFWMIVTIGLIMSENLSNALVLTLICLVMCFVGRVKTTHLLLVALIGFLGSVVMVRTYPKRASRLETQIGFRLPFSPNWGKPITSDDRFQSEQGLIAIAMGKLTGVGIGKSVQRDFVPEPYNDFIYAIISEEWGLLGALMVLAIFAGIVFRGFMRVARDAPDPLGLFMALGITLTIGIYGLTHMCVVTGLLPVTGLPLPFISYGGTAMIVMGVMMGVLLNISLQTHQKDIQT